VGELWERCKQLKLYGRHLIVFLAFFTVVASCPNLSTFSRCKVTPFLCSDQGIHEKINDYIVFRLFCGVKCRFASCGLIKVLQTWRAGDALTCSHTTGCSSLYDRLSIVLRAVVHRHTSGCLSSCERLSVAIRTYVHFPETFKGDIGVCRTNHICA
jgi:hypothetical protein